MFTIHLIEMPFNKIIIKEAQKVIVKKNPRKKSHQFVVFCLKCFFRKSFSAMHRKRFEIHFGANKISRFGTNCFVEKRQGTFITHAKQMK